MGVIKRGILGGFSNKVANIVGSSWKGIAVIKSLPLSVANPNTASQQLYRGRFGQVVAVASTLLATVVKPMWDRFAQFQSGFNAFIQANIANFNASGVVNYALFVISQGSLTGVSNFSATKNEGSNALQLAWDDNSSEGNASASDVLYVAYYNLTKDYWIGANPDTDTRTDASGDIADTVLENTDTIHVYGGFRKADGTLVSDSSYVLATT